MSDHSTHFEASGGGLVLTNAILLYRNQAPRNLKPYGASREDAPAFASIHSVEHDGESQPTIAAGVPLSRAHLRQWTEALGRTVIPEILPGNILVAHPDMLAWWVPAQVRLAYFALSSHPVGLRALSARTTVPVPYPAHLFIATRSGLGVYALPANERPTADTHVLHSPVLNVFVDGRLCWGNIPSPKALTIASIPEYESAVFDSWSTHPNPGQEQTVSGKGGLVRLWDDLAARGARHFPVRRLKRFGTIARRQALRPAGLAASDNMTVGKLIATTSARR
jgi:PRTRC genetic system protein B